MICFEGDVEKDELCGIIIEALKAGRMRSRELRSICKKRYAEFLMGRKYGLGFDVSDSEIYYRIRRLLRDRLIRRDQGEYSITEKGREIGRKSG